MHPIHDIELGENVPSELVGIIETPTAARCKYAINKTSGLLELTKFLPEALSFPANYGSFPKTLSSDGDPLDLVMPSLHPIPPLTMVRVRPIGVMALHYPDKGMENKILAVACEDDAYEDVKDVHDLPERQLEAIKQFFETFKEDEGKDVEVRRVLGRARALTVIRKAIENYRENWPMAA